MAASSNAKPDLGSLKIDPNLKQRSNTSKQTLWIIGIIILVLAFLIGSLVLYDSPVEVETITAQAYQSGQGLTVLNASGYVTPRQRATVAAKVTGQVMELFVEEGMAVSAGQVLARLDDADARARVNASSADLEVSQARIPELEVNLKDAERDLNRVDGLFAKAIASQEDLDKARMLVDRYRAQLSRVHEEVLAANARVRMAEQDLENCTIRAPFAGIVVSKDAQVGEMVSPISAGGGYTRTGIATIVDMQSLEIEVDVNESSIASVKVGQKVIATLDAYPQWKIPASVLTLIPTADRQKATVKVRIAFDKLDPKILPDMGVKVAFKTENTSAHNSVPSVVVPKSTVRHLSDQSIVFVCTTDVLERRAVKTGRVAGDTVEILAGLTPGEQVVVPGPEELKDGQEVVVK